MIRIILCLIFVFISELSNASSQTVMAHCNKSEFVIAIDIGHDKKNFGALSSRGIGEYFFNRTIAMKLYERLKKEGFSRTFLINESGNKISLKKRVDIANSRKSKLFISIHHDSVQEKYLSKWNYESKDGMYCDLFSGYSIFVSKKNTFYRESLNFAEIVGQNFRNFNLSPTLHHAEAIQGENRELLNAENGIYNADFAVLTSTNMPAILIECGVIVNREEESLLIDEEYQQLLVLSLIKSVIYFYGNLL